MNTAFVRLIGVGSLALAALGIAHASTAQESEVEALLSVALEGVENTDVIVSRATFPPDSSLPMHWHPGEEFAYVLEGSAILRQPGKEDIVVKQGEVSLVPIKAVHTAVTGEEGATVLIFRIHEQGQPERVLVDQAE